VAIGALFAMQIGLHRRARSRAPHIPATSSPPPPVSPG